MVSQRRARVLFNFKSLVEANADDLAQILSEEPFPQTVGLLKPLRPAAPVHHERIDAPLLRVTCEPQNPRAVAIVMFADRLPVSGHEVAFVLPVGLGDGQADPLQVHPVGHGLECPVRSAAIEQSSEVALVVIDDLLQIPPRRMIFRHPPREHARVLEHVVPDIQVHARAYKHPAFRQDHLLSTAVPGHGFTTACNVGGRRQGTLCGMLSR